MIISMDDEEFQSFLESSFDDLEKKATLKMNFDLSTSIDMT